MFTCNGRTYTSTAIARLVEVDSWVHVPAADQTPDQWGNPRGGCTWLINYIPEPFTDPETGDVDFHDDYEPRIRECGAELAYTDDRWRCAAGHEHVSAQARDREGWDYAEDTYDAAVIGRAGRRAVPMGGSTLIDAAEAARLMAAL